ncbi:hypothetical protein [Arthrobacter sp. zg-Y1143]|uniref:hypothetical protein n=1 Tax=Arthrobacter sp. zg-Y1143 TaxID=3049065 RepID=UPI0024C3BE68|nr:hypothetical protein [Arthrobacter sp. zg-Y1143]MDK1327462.1 hypothetical protein [Arthrobacter sp. zg-Y1143]
MSRRIDAGTFLTVGFFAMVVALFTTFLAFGYESELRPRHSACFYGQQVPRRQWVLALSLVPPVTAAAALAVWINWAIGIDAIEHSQRLAEGDPVFRICPEDLGAPG